MSELSLSNRPLRLLTSTMFGRLAASLLLAVGVTFAVMDVLIVQDRTELSMRVGSIGDSSRRIAEIALELQALDRYARAAQRKRLSADTRLQVEPESYPGRSLDRHEVAAIERAFIAELRDRLGDGYRSRLDRVWRTPDDIDVIHLVPRGRHASGTSALDVWLGLPDGDTLVFRVAAPMPDPPLPWQLFLQLGVLTLALVVLLFLVTRSITRPLSRLALAAESVGRGARHPPLVEEGVREIREATRAFNTMQDRLLRYLDSRTSVLAAMSHDLRTPLTRMRLRVESVSEGAVRARFGADLDEMENLVESALALFEGLQDNEAFAPVHINAMLATMVSEYAEIGASVSLEGTALAAIDAKPRALKRCLTNLVDNALKFGNCAMIRIQDGDALNIAVSDDGPGIPEELLGRVFEPFYRVESSRSRDTGGTGLGLSIARDIAQAHGGMLTLRNRPEGGLTAQLHLPR